MNVSSLVSEELETDRLLTISTAHITPETADWLDGLEDDLPVYSKKMYGWFIEITSEWFDRCDITIPEDFANLIAFCLTNHIDTLCLDTSAETLDILPEYDWDDDEE